MQGFIHIGDIDVRVEHAHRVKVPEQPVDERQLLPRWMAIFGMVDDLLTRAVERDQCVIVAARILELRLRVLRNVFCSAK